nr:XdhC family protein [uncultured Undibacterium sp.]
MDSQDLEVLKICEHWLNAGQACELVTVVKTWGSSPRPEGSMLAIGEGGQVVGSVSGGCIEDDLIARVQEHGFQRMRPELVTYGITADEAHRFGLPCGGTIQLLIEPLTLESKIKDLLVRLGQHELVARHVEINSGTVILKTAQADDVLTLNHKELINIHGPRWRLLIIGAGQLSRFLATIALGMDYQVTVCDPREEYQQGWQVDGVRLVHEMPDDTVLAMQLDGRSAVVALTHDPKLDDMALIEALKSSAFYVGAIGSRVNNAKRKERLLEFDLSETQVQKLHGPIGIYIGSKTPAEIAISILAEMTAIKNKVNLAPENRIDIGKKQMTNQAQSGTSTCSV